MMEQGAYEMTWLDVALTLLGGVISVCAYWLPYFFERGLV